MLAVNLDLQNMMDYSQVKTIHSAASIALGLMALVLDI